MKARQRLAVVFFVAVGAVYPCSTALSQAMKLPGLVQEGHYDPGNLGLQRQPASRSDDAGAIYGVGPWPTYTPPLADGDGKMLAQSFCAMCHSTTYITMQPPLPAATWERLVHKMIDTFGAPIPEASAKEIILYLQRHYTPETRTE
jgi:hypothetical protein